MNILILQGSPRANGNTAWMAEEYRKAAESVGHKVTLVDVAHKKIAGCLACEYCHGKGNGACVQKDDMEKVMASVRECDAIVFATPVYYAGMTAQISAAIQRFYAIGKPPKATKAALLMSGAAPDFDPATATYRQFIAVMGLADAGVVTAKIDEQKTGATRDKILKLVKTL